MIRLLFLLIYMLSFQVIAGDGAGISLAAKKDSLSRILSHSYDGEPVKCAFGLVNEVILGTAASERNQQNLSPLLFRPVTDTSVITPRGFFRVHYNKSGNDAPAYSIEELLLAADSSYIYETAYLGFPPPPFDNGQGGDSLYDIYILNLGGVYGFTEIEDEIVPGSQRYTSYIMMDNDFLGFYTTGIEAARVTVAHEIHHGIQIGSYIVRQQNGGIIDTWFYEMTSTAMEEFVFDSVNDYYGYLNSFFTGADRSFAQNSGYNLAHWNIYLRDRHNDLTMFTDQWTLLKDFRALQAIEYSLTDRGSSFKESLHEFSVWCYFTNYRFKAGYFEEGISYPAMKPRVTANMNSSLLSMQFLLKPASLNYIQTVNTRGGLSDTLFIIYVNGDVRLGIDSMNSLTALSMLLSDYNATGSIKLTDYYYLRTETLQPLLWSFGAVLNNFLIPSGGIGGYTMKDAYPSPFIYSRHQGVTIPLEQNRISGELDFAVYTASMDLVWSELVRTTFEGQNVVKWNPVRNSRNEKLPSGVYLYILRRDDFVQKGKFTVIHE
ncbi:MAG: hypothetical protein HRU80_15610 [Ignavibacteriales bacterium]|nr:MAG: hypothetical protein HRU80_15610 [Ignavibacteriales bacterium]